ncbi:YhgE/Pip family protein [Paucilactobacillus sp. N302-9]
MLQNIWSAKSKRISYVVLACLIPAVLLIAIFNFIQYEQKSATKNVPVAVVNKDQAAVSNGKTINVGKQVVSTLKKDHQVNWEFVSEKTAKKQLASGQAYLEIELPKDFSKNAGTVLDKNPKVSLIKLHKSPRDNFLSSMVTTTVADTVQAKVKTDLQKAYSETLLSGLKKLGDGTKQAATGTTTLDKGMLQLKDGNEQVARNLNVLATKMVTFDAGTKTLDSGLNTYKSGVDSLVSANQQMNAGLTELQAKAQPLVSGTSQLATGSKSLADGVNQYTNGVSDMNAANQKVLGGLTTMNQSTGSLGDGTTALAAGSQSLAQGIHNFRYGIDDGNPDDVGLDAGIQQIKAGVSANDKIIASVSDMTKLMKQAQTDTTQVQTDMNNLQSGLDTLNSMLPLLSKVQQMKGQLGILNFIPNSDAVKSKQTDANSKAKAVLDAVNALPADTPNLADLKTKAQASVTSTSTLGSTAVTEANALQTVKTQANDALSGFTLDQDTAQGMIDDLQNLQTESTNLLNETTPLLSDDTINELNSVASSTQDLKDGLDHLQLVADTNLDKLSDGANQVADGNAQLADQTPSLIDGIKQLFTGESQIVSGGKQLEANKAALQSGANQVASGNKQLSDSAPALIGGVAQLVSGSNQITQGGSQLKSGGNQLVSGSRQISDGSSQIKSGTSQLADGSDQVQAGLVTATDGVTTLNTKLVDGAQQIGDVNAGTGNVNHFATPVSSREKDVAANENLKNVFAPLVLAFALFIGAVVTQLGLFIPNKKQAALKDEPLAAIATTALVQSLIALVVVGVMGVTVQNWLGLAFFTIVTSALFTGICMILYHMFGRVGVLFAVLLALLQIVITGQVFPNAMLSGFYQSVASVLPMTYAIHGFDKLINGASYSAILMIVAMTAFTAILGGIAYVLDLIANRSTDNKEKE